MNHELTYSFKITVIIRIDLAIAKNIDFYVKLYIQITRIATDSMIKSDDTFDLWKSLVSLLRIDDVLRWLMSKRKKPPRIIINDLKMYRGRHQKPSTPAPRFRITPRLEGCPDNALKSASELRLFQPNGLDTPYHARKMSQNPMYVLAGKVVGSLLQDRLPKVGLGLSRTLRADLHI